MGFYLSARCVSSRTYRLLKTNLFPSGSLWLAGEQSRRGEPVAISYQELAENTGLSRSATQTSIRWLAQRKLLIAKKANATAIPVYAVQRPWRRH